MNCLEDKGQEKSVSKDEISKQKVVRTTSRTKSQIVNKDGERDEEENEDDSDDDKSMANPR